MAFSVKALFALAYSASDNLPFSLISSSFTRARLYTSDGV